MNEGDVVLLSPACKHQFLGDEAVVVSSSTAFVLGVGHTLVGTPGLVVVVGDLLPSCLFPGKKKKTKSHVTGVEKHFHMNPCWYSPTVVGGNHPINFDVVAYFDGDDHGEPTCAQPGLRFLPEDQKKKKPQ